ncbi:Rrf2 family transcriptional regulator [Siccirubricoccus deserti]|uniref:Rrf2 family transcriptional regulator n=2 Tax=Siccirubricoccus deserti TaxID=2013562 RepID=A0A9X0QUS4_9PROT|nr:Rrf2 family transcriptional regulator [Siccirubricoccus deserti]MBC4014281.1 Rrf2 family transcriptional regulator [Siccirubricoccus deserti]GGC28026.1 Rrf2 family transcriptional regulator [Siccirubricoccus deserti]
MRLSTRGRYAVMAMVELATRQQAGNVGLHLNETPGQPPGAASGRAEDRPVSLAEIAQAQLLSLAYLEQLFGNLRRAGLVASARGPGGGYRLARAATAIAVADIIDAVDEPLRATRCEADAPGCLAGKRCLTHDLWSELGEQIRLFLANVTLADICAGNIAGRAVCPLRQGLAEVVE